MASRILKKIRPWPWRWSAVYKRNFGPSQPYVKEKSAKPAEVKSPNFLRASREVKSPNFLRASREVKRQNFLRASREVKSQNFLRASREIYLGVLDVGGVWGGSFYFVCASRNSSSKKYYES